MGKMWDKLPDVSMTKEIVYLFADEIIWKKGQIGRGKLPNGNEDEKKQKTEYVTYICNVPLLFLLFSTLGEKESRYFIVSRDTIHLANAMWW
jgi:hypothetical protein